MPYLNIKRVLAANFNVRSGWVGKIHQLHGQVAIDAIKLLPSVGMGIDHRDACDDIDTRSKGFPPRCEGFDGGRNLTSCSSSKGDTQQSREDARRSGVDPTDLHCKNGREWGTLTRR